MIFGREEPSWVAVDELIIGEHEFGKELVGVHFVDCFACVVSEDFVFVILIEAVALTWRTGFRETIWVSFPAFVKDDKLGLLGALAGFAEVSPESGFFDVVASTVVEVSRWFVGDLCGAGFSRWSAHVGGAIDWLGVQAAI